MGPTCQPSSPPSLSFFSPLPLPHPPLFCAAAEAAGTGGRRCLTARPRQGRRPDQPAPATAPSHRLGHVSAMREPSRRAARGLAGHHDERCALHPAPSPTQLSPPSLASSRRLPLPSPLLFPPRAKPSSSRSPERRRCPLGCRGSSVRPASERGPWRSAHAHGARAAQRRDGLARRPAGVGGQEASGAGQGHGEAHRPSSAWGAAARRRVDDVRRRWRWSSAEDDLR